MIQPKTHAKAARGTQNNLPNGTRDQAKGRPTRTHLLDTEFLTGPDATTIQFMKGRVAPSGWKCEDPVELLVRDEREREREREFA